MDEKLRIKLAIDNIAFFLLCAYIALNALGYISWMPTRLSTVTLYGFIFMYVFSTFISRGRIHIDGHIMWYLGFFAICVLSLFNSTNKGASINQLVNIFKVLIYVVVFRNIVSSERRCNIILNICAISSFLLFSYLFFTNQLHNEVRLGGNLTGNANTFALLFMVSAIASIFLYLNSTKKGKMLFYFGLFLIDIYALILSGGRKFFILPMAIFCMCLIMKIDENGRRKVVRRIIIVFFVIAVLFWAMLNVDFMYNSLGYRMEGLLALITGVGQVDASAKARMEMITQALELWINHIIIGNGPDGFCNLTFWGCYSHNNFVELLCNHGIIGFMVYYSFLIFLPIRLLRTKINNNIKCFWIFAVCGLLIFDYGCVSYNVYSIHTIYLLASSVTDKGNPAR